MPAHEANPAVLYSFGNPQELVTSLAEYIIKAQTDAIEKKNKFSIAISGGSLPKQLGGLVGHSAARWDKWHVYFSDERAVPFDDPDSNYKLVNDEFLSKVTIPEANIHRINTELLGDLDELADEYESQLIQSFAAKDSARFPVFDVIMLGMGPDGHTASLFPDHALLSETTGWVVPIDDSPKPPPRRITLTLPVINHAARVVFVATGAGKQDTLKTILDEPEKGLPCSRVRPAFPGTLHWFVDDAASEKVVYERSKFKL